MVVRCAPMDRLVGRPGSSVEPTGVDAVRVAPELSESGKQEARVRVERIL